MVEITLIPKQTWDTGFNATLVINNTSNNDYGFDWKIQCILPPNSTISWMHGIYISNIINGSIILYSENYITPLNKNTIIELDFNGIGDIPTIYNFIQGVETSVVDPPPISNPTFYPYINMDLMNTSDNLIDIYSDIDLKTFNLGYVVSNNSNPSWGNDSSLDVDSGIFDSLISNILSNGGDVIISFGKDDNDLVNDITEINDLVAAYQSVITRYGVNHISFNSNVTETSKINLRSQAIKLLQDSNPGLKVNLTLDSTTTGFTSIMMDVINSAITYNCQIYSYELKYMNTVTDTGLSEADNIILALKASYQQVISLGFSNPLISVLCCIGNNNTDTQLIFTNNDMFIITNYAYITSFLNNISFWSVNRDVDNSLYDITYDETKSGIPQALLEYSKICLRL